MMASIDTILDHVMPHAPHLGVDLARIEIRKAAIDFCRKTKADRRTLAAFDTTVGNPFYTLSAPENTAISEIIAVKLDDDDPGLNPVRQDEIPADAQTITGKPKLFSAEQGGTRLQLILSPDAVYAVDVTVALEPASTSTVIADWIAQRYAPEIGYGALASLLAQPSKPWSNPALAGHYKGLFGAAILDVSSAADQGFTAAPTRTRPVFGLR